MQRRIRQ